MRRILLYSTGTLAGLVAVMLYPTSTNQSTVDASAVTTAQTSSAATDASSSGSTSGSTSTDASAGTAPSTSTDSSATADPSASASTDTATTSGLADGSYSASSTMRYGTVTVTVTVSGGVVTDVQASQDSGDAKSRQIAAQAIPTLNSEAVQAQSASISMVSHATYTSDAYLTSLQDALDQAAA